MSPEQQHINGINQARLDGHRLGRVALTLREEAILIAQTAPPPPSPDEVALEQAQTRNAALYARISANIERRHTPQTGPAVTLREIQLRLGRISTPIV